MSSGRSAVSLGSSWRRAAGRRIPRIDERLLAAGQRLFIECLETGSRHEHFTAYLQRRRVTLAVQPQRHRVDSTNVVRNVLARRAVAAGRAPNQLPVLVQQTDRGSIELGLRGIVECCRHLKLQPLGDSAMKVFELFLAERVVERQHRHRVLYGAESRDGLTANPLGRRIRCHELRMLGLQCLELAHHSVVLDVRDLRVVQHVVPVVVMTDLLAKRRSLLCLLRRRQPSTARAYAAPGECSSWMISSRR